MGATSLNAGSFYLNYDASGHVPIMLPLPCTSDGSALFNVLTGKPLTKNGHGKKLSLVLEEAKNSPSQTAFLRIFRNHFTGLLEVSDGTEEQGLADFNLIATYRLVFGETAITVTPHFAPLLSSLPLASPAPYYPLHPPAPHQWYLSLAESLQNHCYQPNPYAAPQLFLVPPQPLQQENFQGPSIAELQRRLTQLSTKLLEAKEESQESINLLEQERSEKEKLLAEISKLKISLLQRTSPTSLSPSSPVTLATPADNSTAVTTLPAPSPETPVAAPANITDYQKELPLKETAPSSPIQESKIPLVPVSSTEPTMAGTKKTRHRKRAKKKDQALIQNAPLSTPADDDTEDDEYQETVPATLVATRTHEELTKQKRTQEETERNHLRKIAQETERAVQTALWHTVETTCARKQFPEAFAAIKTLNQKDALYVKGLLTIIQALSKTAPGETYPEIIEAVRSLSKAKNSREEWIIKKNEDRKLLIEFLLTHASEEDKEGLFEEAAKLGNVLATTHWHLLQMKKAPEPCNKKNCVHKVALQFFSSQSGNITLLRHTPRYLVMIKAATQCPHEKDARSIIGTLLIQARSSGLSETDIQTIELQIPDEYKEIPVATNPPVSKKPAPLITEEKFNLCKTTAIAAIEKNDLQAAKDATVVFIHKQKETSSLEALVNCLTEGLATVDAQSSVALQLTTLMCIETIIYAFKEKLPLEQLETLRKLFEKIPMTTSNPSQTRPQRCLAQLQSQLSSILNHFFIQMAYLHANFCQAKTAAKKQRIFEEQSSALFAKAQTRADSYRIMRSLINYRSDGDLAFRQQFEKCIKNFLTNHPEKKSIWNEYLINTRLNLLREEFEKRKETIPKAQIIRLEIPKIFESVETRKEAETFMQALTNYSDTDPFSFFSLTITFLSNCIDKKDAATQEIWKGLFPIEKRSSSCTIL